MEQYTEYQTIDGQRWDAIAYRLYGDPYGYERIMRANPAYLSLATLPGGIILRVPVVEEAVATIPVSSLPPWKR